MKGELTAVFEKRGRRWIGYVEELPGANTQGRTLNEARENLKEAIELVVAANREQATADEHEGSRLLKEPIKVVA
ncbi:MAG: type II toxin-antitoxin system HicB family antitoxin [Myxococcales bacterium]|nr:MAG: type II toxin-antitoxin system HicB family antitoxin [Myxococcales bacterium]